MMLANTKTEKRIGNFDRAEMGDIVDILANWRLMLGVTSEVTKEELIFITQFLFDNYKHFTLTDLNTAKTWAIMGRTDIGFVSQKTLSSFYISKCLNAYEDEKRNIINEIDRKRERYLNKIAVNNPPTLTLEDEANTFKDYMVALYKNHKDQQPFIDLGDMFYNWGKKVGLVKPTPKEVDDAMNYAIQKVREAKHEESLSKTLNQIYKEDDETRKKKFARMYIIKLIFDKYTLTKLIGFIKPEQFKK